MSVSDQRAPEAKPPDAAIGPWRRLRPVIVFATFVLVTAVLYAARAVLVPIALAILLSFLLSPVVGALERRVGRVSSVFLIVVFAFSMIGGVAWMLVTQATSLADELPKYRHNISRRITDLRGVRQNGPLEKLKSTAKDVINELERTSEGPAKDRAVPGAPPQRVVVTQTPSVGSAWGLPATIAPLLQFAASAGLVVALVVFMLARRQELRNRIIRLVGYGRLTLTTKALDEAGARVSQYLLMQSIVNASLGIAVGVGLSVIGLPYAALWGFLAGVLRFIPYVGTWTAALMPITLSLAVYDGWTRPLLVAALYLVLEPLVFLVLEPLIYGQSTGVSDVALLVAAAFWTWLWEPVGLILAAPLTVCVAVFGKYVTELEFIPVILGDEPALEPEVKFYQRLLARDPAEASEIVDAFLDEHPADEVCDAMLIPALSAVRNDMSHGRITDDDVRFVLSAMRDVVASLEPAPRERGETPVRRVRILGCPAIDAIDELAFMMFQYVLDPARWEIELASAEMLSSEVVALVSARAPVLICVGVVAPGGVPQARYLVKRLRARFPDVKIIAGQWGGQSVSDAEVAGLRHAGADEAGTTLLETREHLLRWLPLLDHGAAPSSNAA